MNGSLCISVIIPVYNTGAFLDECIASAVGQTYTNLQLILIDDGSTDGSSAICDRWAEKDDRILVIHQKNAGVSAARNAGLDAATGDLIAFLDSDDTLPPDAYAQLVKSMGDTDLVMGCMQSISENGMLQSRSFIPALPPERDVFLLELFEERQGYYLGFLWDKLLRRAQVENRHIRFDPQIKLNEDRLFLTEYLICCDSVALSEAVVYHYRQRGSSVMQQTRNSTTVKDSEMTVLDSFERLIPLARKHSAQFYAAVVRKAFVSALDLRRRVSQSDRSKLRRISQTMRKTTVLYLRAETVSPGDRIKLAAHCLLER